MRLLLTALILFLAACSKEEGISIDANGVTTKSPSIWGTSISNDGQLAQVVCKAQVVYSQKKVLVGANEDQKRFLYSLDSETGKVNWRWGDLLSQLTNPTYVDPLTLDEDQNHVYDGKLSFIHGGNTYIIDLLEGKTLHKNQVTLLRRPTSSGISSLLFTSGSVRNSLEPEGLYVNDLQSPKDPEFIVMPIYDRAEVDVNSVFKGLIWETIPFEKSGELLIAVFLGDPVKIGGRASTALGLYNYTQRRWVYERATLNGSYPNSNVSWAKLYNGKVYHTSTRSMQCNDVMTGEELWRVDFDQGFGSSGFIIQDGKIYGNNDNRYTYCLDPQTGRQLWKEESSGSASPISYLNGVLYFMGGGDGRLHAIDATTGKHLWRLRSPDVDKNSGAFFYGTCVAVPGQGGNKGRIVATTGLNAYGYEAIR